MTAKPGTPSSIAGSVLPLKKAEELLQSLQGVVSARIVADASGGVDTIHILVTGDSTPKQVVRNVESALMAHLGMRVDHRKISVATTVQRSVEREVSAGVEVATSKKGEPPVENAPTRGLYFEDVEVRGSRAKGVTCKVTLRRGAEQFVGESEGMETGDKARVELSARATLAAIALSDGAGHQFSLDGAKVLSAFDHELVLVGVTVRMGRNNQLLTGSCAIKDSAETASALAVLNATNRWVEGIH